MRQVTGPAAFSFWYDHQEPGFPEFYSLNSIFIWGYRTLGMEFPAIPQTSPLKAGTILVVPSERPDVAVQGSPQLRSRGLEATPFRSEPLTVPGASYRIYLLRVSAAAAH